jgi:hypothetical protein
LNIPHVQHNVPKTSLKYWSAVVEDWASAAGVALVVVVVVVGGEVVAGGAKTPPVGGVCPQLGQANVAITRIKPIAAY